MPVLYINTQSSLIAVMSVSKRPSHFRVNNTDLLCKNKCGYYGNPQWKGYCSVCYKKLSGKGGSRAPPQPSNPPHSMPHSAAGNAEHKPRAASFSRFEEKRKQQAPSPTPASVMKSFFTKKQSPKLVMGEGQSRS